MRSVGYGYGHGYGWKWKCVDEVWFLNGVLVGFMFCSLHSGIKCGHLCAILIMPLKLNFLLLLLIFCFLFFFLVEKVFGCLDRKKKW